MTTVVFDVDGALVNGDKLYPAVAELLPILRRLGFRLQALGSAERLAAHAIDGYFDVVVADVQAIGAAAYDDIVLVSGTVSHLQAGQAAGLGKLIGVTHRVDGVAEQLQTAGAHHVVRGASTVLDALGA